MVVLHSGFHTMTDAEYFKDPCPEPSLTQTFAKALLERSPRHLQHLHPRLNPRWQPEQDEKYDIGATVHLLLFGKDSGREPVPLDFPDWRTKAAREKREEVIQAGNIPILQHMYRRAENVELAFRQQTRDWFEDTPGDFELVAIHKHKLCWLRTKMDWLSKNRRVVIDYKTTKEEIKQSYLEAYAIKYGWDIQAAMHKMILDSLDPASSGRRLQIYVLQETYPPYVLYRCTLSESLLELGTVKLARAMRLWRDCLAAKEWPGPEQVTVMPPSWALNDATWQQVDMFEAENDA